MSDTPDPAKLLTWQYRRDQHCGHFVRFALINWFGVPESFMPEVGCLPLIKAADHDALLTGFAPVTHPQTGCLAAHYQRQSLTHVGVVVGNEVWHVSRRFGGRRDPINQFVEQKRTRFYLWRN